LREKDNENMRASEFSRQAFISGRSSVRVRVEFYSVSRSRQGFSQGEALPAPGVSTGPAGGDAPASANSQSKTSATSTTPVSVNLSFALLKSASKQLAQRSTTRNLQYISSSNTKFSITVTPLGGTASGPYTGSCTTASCSVSFTANPGPNTIAISLTDTAANLLSKYSTFVDVQAATLNTLSFTANPVVSSVTLQLAATGENAGTPVDDLLTVHVKDVDGNTIIGNAPYVDVNGNPVSFTLGVANSQAGGKGVVTIKGPSLINAPTQGAIYAHYDGNWLASSAISVTSSSSAVTSLTGTTLTTIPRTQEFTTITANSQPNSIVAGPDGNLWFTETTGTIGVVSLRGAMLHEYATWAGAVPENIALGADGNLYFTNYNGGNFVGKMTPTGAVTKIATGLNPTNWSGLVLAPDGNIWALANSTDGVARITPQGQVTLFTNGFAGNYNPSAICIGPDGNLWASNAANHFIDKIGLNGQVTQYNPYTAIDNDNYSGIVTGPDGNIWFVEDSLTKIGVVSPSGTLVGAYSTGLGASPLITFLTLGPDGNIWFSDWGNNAISRITPIGTITEYGTGITANAGPNGILLASDGNIWFTEGNSNRIGRFVL
jgi:streptogramin lyase